MTSSAIILVGWSLMGLWAVAAASRILVPPLVALQKDQFEVDIECRVVVEEDFYDHEDLRIQWDIKQTEPLDDDFYPDIFAWNNGITRI